MQNNDDIVEELSKLNSSIIHDALRSEGFSDQTLPPEIRPFEYSSVLERVFEKFDGKVLVIFLIIFLKLE